MKLGLLSFAPEQVGALRILFSAFVFLPVFIRNLKKYSYKEYRVLFVYGALGVGFPPFLYTFAQTHIDSSTAGILNSLVPLWTLITGIFAFSQKFEIKKMLGVSIGLAGALILTFARAGENGLAFDFSNAWGLLVVVATLCYGLADNLLKAKLQDYRSAELAAFAFGLMSVPAFIILLSTDLSNIDIGAAQVQKSLIAILILSIFGSALAQYLFAKLIQKSNPLFASFVTYLIPIIALMWGAIDGESIGILHFVGLIVILSSIYFINSKNTSGH
jgi:drug/metabolite transporter (DMT)-like permease